MAGARNEKSGEATAKDWAEQLKKVAYAAAGAVNVSQEDVKQFVSKLVEKGELAQKDGKKILKDLTDRLKKTVREPRETAAEVAQPIAESGEKLAERINASIQRVLHGMNIATRQDVADLGRQIDELDSKLRDLLEAQGARREPARAGS
jgi:poly(hydroxyalkanoate) granule-associated protein